MKFGPVAVGAAQGTVLGHSVKLPEGALRKGKRLGPAEIALLEAAGLASVIVARLEAGDVAEDEAAQRMAEALAGAQVEIAPANTGRSNLYSRHAGVVVIDAPRIDAMNAVDEGLTVATLRPYDVVTDGQMLATIKVIPYAVRRTALEEVLERAEGGVPAISVAAFRGLSVGLIMTRLPDTRASVLAKMRAAVQKRLTPLLAQLSVESVVAHEAEVLGAAIESMALRPDVGAILISGVAATVDRADVVPAAVERAGGTLLHVGMPVDPGNLLLLASLQRADSRCMVVGIPTCARSPKLNGFDFVLRRLAAGIDVSSADLRAMGVGGLLTEIPSRPMPRGF